MKKSNKKSDESLSLDEVKVATPSLTDFDPFKVGKVLANETAVLEVHIGKPGFKKSIDSAHFMKTLEGLSEDQIAALSPEMKKMVDRFRAGTAVAESTEEKDESSIDPDMIHVSQDLIDKKSIMAITKHDNRFKKWIGDHSIASPIKFQGAYLMRLNMIDEIDQAVLEFSHARKELVTAFGERWELLIENAKSRRGPFFDASDYPSFNLVRGSYSVHARWLSFNVPAALEKINEEIYKRESEKAQVFFADVAQEARDAARVAFKGLTEHLLSQLGNDDSGKPKRFMGGSLNKLKEFAEMFLGGGDLTGDGELHKYVKMAKDILSNVDPAEVRKEEALRDALHSAVTTLQSEASKLIVIGTRKFALDAYEDDPVALSID